MEYSESVQVELGTIAVLIILEHVLLVVALGKNSPVAAVPALVCMIAGYHAVIFMQFDLFNMGINSSIFGLAFVASGLVAYVIAFAIYSSLVASAMKKVRVLIGP